MQLRKYKKEMKIIDKVQTRKLLFTTKETTQVFSKRDMFLQTINMIRVEAFITLDPLITIDICVWSIFYHMLHSNSGGECANSLQIKHFQLKY